MPDRIIRQAILDSERVNQLTWPGEVFYRRLMSIVDDFGRYDGRVSIIRAQLYPLKINEVSNADVAKWLDECSNAGLVSVYEVENRPYLELLNFNQRLRTMRSKFPKKCGNFEQNGNSEKARAAAGNCGELLPETKRNESETNPNPKRGGNETNGNSPPPRSEICKNLFEYLKKNKKRFYPVELIRAQNEVIKFQEQNGITQEKIISDPALKKRFDDFDEKVFKKHLASEMLKDIEDMWDHYEAQNYTIKGQLIENWKAVMKGWMKKKGEFEARRMKFTGTK